MEVLIDWHLRVAASTHWAPGTKAAPKALVQTRVACHEGAVEETRRNRLYTGLYHWRCAWGGEVSDTWAVEGQWRGSGGAVEGVRSIEHWRGGCVK